MQIEKLIAPFDGFVAPDLKDLLAQWTGNMLFERHVSDHTVKNYLHDLKHFCTFQG